LAIFSPFVAGLITAQKGFLVPGGMKKWEAHLWSRTAVHLSGPYEAFVYVSDLVEKWGGTELLCFENLRQHSG
jgi:hypothetical protein